MKTKEMMSRRNFLQLSAGAGLLAGLSRFELEASAAQQDYKALVCVFLFGGNDGHNVVVPLNPTQYTAYQQARGALVDRRCIASG
ncbi:MAG TPA: twin-arginine translocation signal domain-containing protein [Blastocatellia bacterium]|nr:twin-arginine translocation signal domain-containing protein [Blastocatellia bacterium]